jgi:subtilisin family serine protease
VSRVTRLARVSCCCLVLSLAVPAAVVARAPATGARGAQAARGGSEVPPAWIATFVERPDLRPALQARSWTRRGRRTVTALRHAYRRARARPRVVRRLRERGAEVTPLWIANAVLFRAARDVADEIAGIDGVTEVVGGRDLDLGAHYGPTTRGPIVDGPNAGGPAAVPASLATVRVPEARADGFSGAGVTVGFVDTGVDARHPDLAAGHRAIAGWFDPTGRCPSGPCDRGGHGTTVAGVAVGARTGVAPGAQWIAARGCTRSSCTLTLVLPALQFMLAPGDRRPDPDLRPEVVNSSWSIDEPSTALGRAMTALHAAGIVNVFAAGNAGPACATVGFPASQPEVVAVGATDDRGAVARFSARGPGPLGPEPALVAPGVSVVTTAAGGGYAISSGTSMAAPVVTGTYALAVQAAPRHRGSPSLHDAVITAASPRPRSACRSHGVPNSAYGHGVLDAAAAVRSAAALG